MNKKFFSNGLVQKATGIAMLGVVLYSTGVFGAFWRTMNSTDPYSSPSDMSSMLYGYGYGPLSWGWGYGYGYGYGLEQVGYYYSTPTGTATDYDNPVILSNPADIISASDLIGSPTTAISLSLKSTVQMQVTVSGLLVKVTIPVGTTITSADGTFDSTALSTANLASYSLASGETGKGAITFGVTSEKLYFSKPVKLEIPVPGYTATTIGIKAKHFGDTAFGTVGLTSSATATCSNGVATPAGSTASVSNQIATIYTCSASDFAAYTSSSSSSSSSGGGGGGGGGIYYNNYTKTQTKDETLGGITTEEVKLSLKEGKVVEDVVNQLNKIEFKTEKYQTAVDSINEIFVNDLGKAELVSMLLGDDNIVADLANSYVNFMVALRSYEAGKITKSDLKAKLASFLKAYDAYKSALSEVASVSVKRINGTSITVIAPSYKDAGVVTAVSEISKRFEKYLIKKGYKGNDLASMYNKYTSFLLGVKVLREKDETLGKGLAKKYLGELSKQLLAKLAK